MLFIYLLLVWNVESIGYSCANETDCNGKTFTSNDYAHAYGYKSLFEAPSPQQSNTDDRRCYGALSCKQSSYISTNYLLCPGFDSCSNIGLIETSNTFMRAYGSHSIMYSNITLSGGADLFCFGDQSCSQSEITINDGATHKISGVGSLSLFNTSINVLQGIATINFYGYYSGFASTIDCKDGTQCNINCFNNGCGGLVLNCDQNAACSVSNSPIALLPNSSVPEQALLFLNSSAITQHNEDECSSQTNDKTFDVAYEHYTGADLIYSSDEGPICCRASSSCSETKIFYNNAATPSVICSGLSGCQSTPIQSNDDISIECSGDSACYQSIISGSSAGNNDGTIWCYGYRSCKEAQITGISTIICSAHTSCGSTNITSHGNIKIYITAYRAALFANVLCKEGDLCTIVCDAFQSCSNMSLTCNGQCIVECNDDTLCPNIFSSNPTNHPSIYPTNIPTFNPTTPTTNPTIIPTYNPSVYPTNIPSSTPTHNPIIYPTKTPVNHPSIYPTIIPTFNPSVYPIHKPTRAEEGIVGLETTQLTQIQTTEPDGSSSIKKQNVTSINLNTITLTVAMIGILVVFIGFINARFVNKNDFYNSVSLITYIIHILDTLYDILFAVELKNAQLPTLMLASIVFIIFPIMISYFQLYWEIKTKWMKIGKNEIRNWIREYTFILSVLSLLSGSAFSAVTLCKSNLLNLKIFDIPLTKAEFLQFHTKRIFSILLFENLPQLAIQAFYIISVQKISNYTVYLTMVFSLLSIIIAITSSTQQKQIIKSQDYCKISFHVTGMKAKEMEKAKNIVKDLRLQIAAKIGVDKVLLEIIKPIQLPNNTLNVICYVHVGQGTAVKENYQQLMGDAYNNGELAQFVQESWNLSKSPIICNLKYRQLMSQNTVQIKSNNIWNNNDVNVIAMSVINNNKKQGLPQAPEVQYITEGFDTTNNEGSSSDSDAQTTKKPDGLDTWH